MAEQELDLLQLSSPASRHRRAQVRRRSSGARFSMVRSFGALPYDMPHDPFRYPVSPGFACAANAAKHAALAHSSGNKPGINGALDPIRNGHRPNMPGLANHVDDGPVVFPPLKMSKSSSAASFRRNPQPNRTPSNARSRLPLSVFGSGACQSSLACRR